MKFNLLGQTGLYVSEICLGTMTFGGRGGIWENIGKVQIEDVTKLLKKSFDRGINFIDTQGAYRARPPFIE